MSERWFKRHRMDWISETLRVFGFINRGHLMRKFDISQAQASVDLRDFQKLYPDAMKYDGAKKKFLSGSDRN